MGNISENPGRGGFRAAAVCAGVFLIPAMLSAAATNPGQSGDLKNVVIEGVPRIQMRGDKLPSAADMDPRQCVEDFLSAYMSENNPLDKLAITLPLYLPSSLASDVVLSPWRGRLVEGPVLSLSIKSPPKVKVAQWRLVIADDRGKVFRTLKGRNSIPDTIIWDGLSDSGSDLKVGHPYAYSLSVLDAMDVPTYLFGKSVTVNGFVRRRRGRLALYMSTENLFTKGPAFSPQGQMFIRESQDLLRKVTGWKITANVYGDDQDLAQREADIIKDFLEEGLHLPKGTIAAKGQLADKSFYHRTEILAVKS
ncbi:MAG TPA: hypothetical protein DCZ93_11345 [Elusimicrobia bacterium]|nr:hypothetical protein [Elusimicrobiota bacterium]